MPLNPYLPLSPSLSNKDYSFGVPDCLTDIAKEILEALLSDVLIALAMNITEGILWAQSKIALLINKFLGWLGIIEYDTVTGKLKFVTDGVFGLNGILGEILGAIAGAIGALTAIADTITQFAEEIAALKKCLEGLKNRQELLADPGANQTNYLPLEERIALYQINAISDWITRANAQLTLINTVLDEREVEPDLDVFEQQEEPIFRLSYGPPKSTEGQFLLSVDGLYFDSQNRQYSDGKIPTPEDIGFVPDRSRWKLEHAPSLGGKGTLITVADLNNYVNTILDIEKIDEAFSMQEYYDNDHLVQMLEGSKAKTITDLDNQKQKLLDDGYTEESAIFTNLQQQIFSEIELYEVKIRKRKKQIEIAVKSTDLFGLDSGFSPGEVPINDFSYLKDINLKVDLKKQRDLVVDQGEVSGIVLPFMPKFVESDSSNNSVMLTPVELTEIGVGTMTEVYAVSSTIKPVLSLHDPVHTDNLVAIYNFINPDVVTPGSTKYNLTNCNSHPEENAQLVGTSTNKVFDKGLGFARLDGIVRYGYDEDTGLPQVSSVGSYVKLKPSHNFDDLTYKLKGFSFDTWVHMPGIYEARNSYEQGADLSAATLDIANSAISAWTDFNYYKLILSNENLGGSSTQDYTSVTKDESTSIVRSLTMGFTRDPIFTSNSGGVPGPDFDLGSTHGVDTSSTTSSIAFFIAPVQSYSEKGASFIRKSDCTPEDNPYYGMSVNLSSTTESGYALSSCTSSFMHLSISFNPTNDSIKLYLNSELLAEDSMSNVFGTEEYHPLRVPTFKKDNSFDYTQAYSGITEAFVNGPENHQYFTPWILGGGWTDGYPMDSSTSSGGFMGQRYGLYSGLTGYLTSFKLYNAPLTKTQVLKNYNAHKDFLNKVEL